MDATRTVVRRILQEQEGDDPFESNKREFGVTDDPKLGFYILPDGTMLDGGGEGYGRAFDHRNIRHARGGTRGMQEFMSLGAIRVFPETGGLDILVPPTSSQYRMVAEWLLYYMGEEIALDLEDGLGEFDEFNDYYRPNQRRENHLFDQHERPAKILKTIRDFYHE